eukprot:3813451-Alexandrium_andersonii.AAC.1
MARSLGRSYWDSMSGSGGAKLTGRGRGCLSVTQSPPRPSPSEESLLWRGVVEALYGPNWRLELLEAQEARQLAVEEDQELRDE